MPLLHEEQKLWGAVAKRDLMTLRSMLSPDFIYVGERIENREQALANIGSCESAKFNYILPKSYPITPEVTIITYRASQDLSCGLGHRPGDVNVSSTWIKRDGQWLLQAHTETRTAVPLEPRLEKLLNPQAR